MNARALQFVDGMSQELAPHLAAMLRTAPDEQVFFAPGPEPMQHTIAAIDGAKKEIRFQAYNFSSPEITAAIVAAKKRGVDVIGLIDHKALCQPSCTAGDCTKAGIPIFDDAKHPIAHAKVIIVDGRTVVCGSYNWSKQAEHNSEDLVILNDSHAAIQFMENWAMHHTHSTRWHHTEAA